MATLKQVQAGILGLAAADALGVPVEFSAREDRRKDPVTSMRGFGSHMQPPGTWSDDTSLTLCTMESLTRGLNLSDIMENFVKWYSNGYLTAGDVRFDIGSTTYRALENYLRRKNTRSCGQYGEMDAGNGSLMRILPMAYYLDAINGAPFAVQANAMKTIHEVCSLTHAHIHCNIACGFYCAIAQALLHNETIPSAINSGIANTRTYYATVNANWREEAEQMLPQTAEELALYPESRIKSSGYVVDTLLASLWCLCTTGSYTECVLCAVNLGHDTDTVGAVAGGLAGIAYGLDAIPKEWLSTLIRAKLLFRLCEDFYQACETSA